LLLLLSLINFLKKILLYKLGLDKFNIIITMINSIIFIIIKSINIKNIIIIIIIIFIRNIKNTIICIINIIILIIINITNIIINKFEINIINIEKQ
jgi:hypothetical protein